MWIFTASGFLSVVKHREENDLLVVRARCKSDIEQFASLVEMNPKPEIHHTPDADYKYRVFVPADVFAKWLSKQAMNITYPNFKNFIYTIQGWVREKIYARVWSVMLALEDLDL